jgi:adenosylcobinamide hydrolase
LQPFMNHEQTFTSAIWPEISIHYQHDHLLFRIAYPLAICGNAILGEHGDADHIVNWKVGKDLDCSDPYVTMANQFHRWQYPVESGVGLMTAAYLNRVSIHEESGKGYRILCGVTAGTGNAARAGLPRPVFEDYGVGTINIVLFIDAKLTFGARMNVIMTAAEAKAAALQDEQIRDHLHGEIATGTTSDAIVLGVHERSTNPIYRYAGTVTPIGNAIGRLVYRAVREAVASQQ